MSDLGDFTRVTVIPKQKQHAGTHELKLVMNKTFWPARLAQTTDERELSFLLNDIVMEERNA